MNAETSQLSLYLGVFFVMIKLVLYDTTGDGTQISVQVFTGNQFLKAKCFICSSQNLLKDWYDKIVSTYVDYNY